MRKPPTQKSCVRDEAGDTIGHLHSGGAPCTASSPVPATCQLIALLSPLPSQLPHAFFLLPLRDVRCCSVPRAMSRVLLPRAAHSLPCGRYPRDTSSDRARTMARRAAQVDSSGLLLNLRLPWEVQPVTACAPLTWVRVRMYALLSISAFLLLPNERVALRCWTAVVLSSPGRSQACFPALPRSFACLRPRQPCNADRAFPRITVPPHHCCLLPHLSHIALLPLHVTSQSPPHQCHATPRSSRLTMYIPSSALPASPLPQPLTSMLGPAQQARNPHGRPGFVRRRVDHLRHGVDAHRRHLLAS